MDFFSRPMPNPLTITQIAEAAGVSTATVDRVLNNRPGVNPGTVHKVRETVIGADNRAAGRTAGLLIGRSLPRESPSLCAVMSPATRYAAEIDRRIGFQQVMEERFSSAQMLRLFELPESDDEAFEYARAALAPVALEGRLAAVYNV